MTDFTTTPRLESSALVTIDLQVDTLDGQPLEIPGTSAAAPRIARLAKAFRGAGRPIAHVVRLYSADGSNAEAARRALVTGPTPVLRPGTPGRLLAPGILETQTEFDDAGLLAGRMQSVGGREVIVYKPRWGAFYGTGLHEHLQSQGVDTIVFAGANFPNCPRTSIYEASERDYRILVADDAISGLDEQGRRQLRGIGVELALVKNVEARLRDAVGS